MALGVPTRPVTTVTVRDATVSVTVTRVQAAIRRRQLGPGRLRERLTDEEAADAGGHEQEHEQHAAQARMAALAHGRLAAALDAHAAPRSARRRRQWRRRAQPGVQSRALRAARAQAASANALSCAQPTPGRHALGRGARPAVGVLVDRDERGERVGLPEPPAQLALELEHARCVAIGARRGIGEDALDDALARAPVLAREAHARARSRPRAAGLRERRVGALEDEPAEARRAARRARPRRARAGT